MQRQLNEKIGEVAETVKQMAQFMMGRSDSLRDAIVAGVKEEFEAKLREEREAHSKEMQSLKDQFALQDGTLDFSNNRCERQIRRLAKYRNNSFFTGSPQAAKRLARLLSHFANYNEVIGSE